MLLDTCTATATTANEGQDADNLREKEDSYQSVNRKGPDSKAGEGPARSCKTLPGHKDFHDGGGLCSSRRWKKEAWKLADGAGWYWQRRELKRVILEFVGSEKELEREAFCMASGGEANGKVARDEGLQKKLLEVIRRW